MNRLERWVYDQVKRHPGLKQGLRDAYQTFFDLVPGPSCRSAYPIAVREDAFFGFHDHTPFSPDNRLLLANRFSIGLRMPQATDALAIGYFHGDGFQHWRAVGQTLAWNWHQGCKLQWCGPGRRLIFNDFADGGFVARIHDVDTGDTRTVPCAISAVSPDGLSAVGYSFERVQRYMPGYGYQQSAGERQIEQMRPTLSGLYAVDLRTGERRDLFSIADVAAYRPEPGSEETWHYLSHALFCPSGRRVSFLHRWVPRNPMARRSRLFTCDLDGRNWHLFSTREMVSHLGWRNATQLVAYCRLPTGEDRYVLFTDQEPAPTHVLGERLFSSDGHPSFSPDGRWMLTDTYPDRRRRAWLVLFDLIAGRRYNIARLRSPRRFASKYPHRHWACDLHPRFDRQGRFLCFDSAHTGRRALCTIDLGEDGLARTPEALSVCA